MSDAEVDEEGPEPTASWQGPAQDSGRPKHKPAFNLTVFVLCVLGSWLGVYMVGLGAELDVAPRRALFILLLAASLWISEAVAAYAVGFLIIGLQIVLLARPAADPSKQLTDWTHVVNVLGDPLVWLFFGGFVLAAGMTRTGLDRVLAQRVLARTGGRPTRVLAGVMFITFVLSMFMSNTATAAMMLGMLAPLLATLDKDEPLAVALCLGVAVAANLGGMGSLIGTPPNAIAVGLVETMHETHVSFLDWVVIGLPPAALIAVLAGWFIARAHRTELERIELPPADTDAAPDVAGWQRGVMLFTLIATAGLWLTGGWHGVPTVVVAFVPIMLLTVTGVLGTQEIRALPYDVLFMLAGGLALGRMVLETGLADWLVEHLPVEGLGPVGAALLMAYVCTVVSNLMSNTAAANILIPVGATLAAGAEWSVAIPVALAASASMCLPIATPPNAMASATGRLSSGHFLRVGLPIALVVPALAVWWTRVAVQLLRG